MLSVDQSLLGFGFGIPSFELPSFEQNSRRHQTAFLHFAATSGDSVRIRLTSAESEAIGADLVFKWIEADDRHELGLDFDGFELESLNRLSLRINAEDGEKVFGGGEQFTHLDLRKGGFYPLWVREQVSDSGCHIERPWAINAGKLGLDISLC